MTKKSLFILFALIPMACFDKPKPQPSIVDNDGIEELYNQEKVDSVCEDKLQKAKENIETEKKIQSSSASNPSRSYSSSSRYEESEYDNMCGFDPASEDDIDDNGMSRYMENNDEEGWN